MFGQWQNCEDVEKEICVYLGGNLERLNAYIKV
jgi:hypothetical protein